MVPVFAVLLAVALAIFASRFGPIFPDFPDVGNDVPAPTPTPGIVWVYLTVAVCAFLTGVVLLAYETVAVAKYERTFGMAWLRVRPLRVDGSAISWGRAFVRALIFWLAGFVGCDETIERLYSYLDGELTEQRRLEITRHLDLCGPCVVAYGFEAELRRGIANRCKDHVPDALVKRVADALTAEGSHQAN